MEPNCKDLNGCYTARSNTAANPYPPPMHIVSSP